MFFSGAFTAREKEIDKNDVPVTKVTLTRALPTQRCNEVDLYLHHFDVSKGK